MAVGIVLLGMWAGCARPDQRLVAIDRGLAFLGSIQRADGAICDTVNPLFDVWETVEAATAVWECRHDSTDPVLRKALAFLQAHENEAGMLCHNVKCRRAYCLETTAEYYLLLAAMRGREAILPRLDTIRRLQQPTGEWRIGNPDVLEAQDFPSVTGFVLSVFAAADTTSADDSAALSGLFQKKVPGTGWGQHWEYYGTPAYAIWAIARALRPHPGCMYLRKEAELDIRQAIGDTGYWEATYDPDTRRISRELEVALYLSALQALNPRDNLQLQGKCARYLVTHQSADGHWDGGFFPIASTRYEKREYVFATARALVALANYQSQSAKE